VVGCVGCHLTVVCGSRTRAHTRTLTRLQSFSTYQTTLAVASAARGPEQGTDAIVYTFSADGRLCSYLLPLSPRGVRNVTSVRRSSPAGNKGGDDAPVAPPLTGGRGFPSPAGHTEPQSHSDAERSLSCSLVVHPAQIGGVTRYIGRASMMVAPSNIPSAGRTSSTVLVQGYTPSLRRGGNDVEVCPSPARGICLACWSCAPPPPTIVVLYHSPSTPCWSSTAHHLPHCTMQAAFDDCPYFWLRGWVMLWFGG
jgi:hypothetical protein